MHGTMTAAVGVLLEAHDKVLGKGRRQQRKRARWKNPSSEELTARIKQLRRLYRMLKAESRSAEKRQARRMSDSYDKAFGIRFVAPREGVRDKIRAWSWWRERAENRIRAIKKECNRDQRRKWRAARKRDFEKMEKQIKNAETRNLFDRLLKDEGDEVDRQCVVVGKDASQEKKRAEAKI